MHKIEPLNNNDDILEPLALYVHWPFCISKCPYCDFNSHVRDTVDIMLWETALLADMAYEASITPNRRLSSIFFGGGTPSLMPPQLVEKIITQARKHWGFDDNIEITLEANPSSVESAKFNDLSCAGVNRVSLGLQSLDDQTLEFLGRAHSVKEGLSALEIAQKAFARTSFDLIYARPKQSLDDWQTELMQALGLGSDHLSLYQLTIEPATRFETLVRNGTLTPADDDICADMFTLTRDITTAAHMPAYEISNHAKLGQKSRHNLIYWRYQDYIGIGPGAHGRRLYNGKYYATERHKKPENYLSAVQRNGHGMKSETVLDGRTRAIEAMMMGLRLKEGIDLKIISTKTGIALETLVDQNAAANLMNLGFVKYDKTHIIVCEKGMPLLDAILPKIIAL